VALVQDVDDLEAGASDAVTLITLHAAKGLEFPFVFIVGLEEGIVPHSRSIESAVQMEEERRLFYVGITRAMRSLFLLHAFTRTTWGSEGSNPRSRFLADIPPELLEQSFGRATGGRRSFAASSSGGFERRSFSPSPPQGRARVDSIGARPSTIPERPTRRPETLPWRSYAQGESDLGPAADASEPDLGPAPRPLPTTRRPIPSAARTPSFQRGARVRHAEYGEGTVLVSSFAGADELVLVKFDVRPDKPKNLSLAVHQLERVS
jgi:DNA helicase-2/ATP-dependent DNA helicase PcrA